MLVEGFLQDKLVKLTHHKKIVTEVTNKEGNAVRVSITPIGEMRDYYGNSIYFKICDDYSVYDKANAITSEQKLTPTMKKKAFEAVKKLSESFISSTDYNFVKKNTHWGTTDRFAVFYGELVDSSYGTVVRTIREAGNCPVFYHNADTNTFYMGIEWFADFGCLLLNLDTGVLELNTMADGFKKLYEDDVVFARKNAYSILKATDTRKKNVVMFNNRYQRVSFNNATYIYDTNSNYYFTQTEFLNGATNKMMLKFDYMKSAVDEITSELCRITDNVYCCAKINRITMPTESFDEDVAGLIFDFNNDRVECGLRYREKTILSMESEELFCENYKLGINDVNIKALDKLRVLNFDKIYVCNSNKTELTFNSDNTLTVNMPLNKELLKRYKAVPTEKKANFAKLQMYS